MSIKIDVREIDPFSLPTLPLEDCLNLPEEKCKEKGWTILTLAIQPDHIHLFVRCFPGDSAADVVKQCKGYTAFHLRREFKPILSTQLFFKHSWQCQPGNYSTLPRRTERSLRPWLRQPPPFGKL